MNLNSLTTKRRGKVLFTFMLSIPLVIGGMLFANVTKTIDYPVNVSLKHRETLSPIERRIPLTPFKTDEDDYIRVNLPKNKISVYEDREEKQSFNILTKGDPQNWGGTPSGEYKIQAKYSSSYSRTAGAFMPWAIKFYGKYYIHGQPYYYNGKKVSSEVSGGCLRLSDKDAKELFILVNTGMPVLVVSKEAESFSYKEEDIEDHPPLSAESYLVADLESGYVFDSKEPFQLLPIASITKLMTATVISEQIDLRKSIVVRNYMLDEWGTTEGLEKGDRISLINLFYRSLVESSNNAASVLNYFLGEEKTVRLMNRKADTIFMRNTSFEDSSGFKQNNKSTAKDLFYLARYILNNRPPLLKISQGKEVRNFDQLTLDLDKLWNKNIFIKDDTFIGGKTGFTDEALNTGLFIFEIENRKFAIIILGSSRLKGDTQKLYIWVRDNYFKEE